MKRKLKFICAFLIIGLESFGNLSAVTAVLETYLIKRNNFITQEDLIDAITLARLGPGATSANVVAILGNIIYGIWGGIVATICYTIFPLITITIISRFLDKIILFESVSYALNGCLICISVLSLKTIYDMAKSILLNKSSIIVFIVCFILSAFFNISGILLISITTAIEILIQIKNIMLSHKN